MKMSVPRARNEWLKSIKSWLDSVKKSATVFKVSHRPKRFSASTKFRRVENIFLCLQERRILSTLLCTSCRLRWRYATTP